MTLDASGTVTGGTALPALILRRYGQDIVGLNAPAQWLQHGGTFVVASIEPTTVKITDSDSKLEITLKLKKKEGNPSGI